MSVRLKISDIEEKDFEECKTRLTYTYTKGQILKNKKNVKVVEVLCYKEDTDKGYIYLPMWWCWKNLRVTNNYEGREYKYKRIREPRDDKQNDELNQVINLLDKKRVALLTLRTGAGKTAVSLFAACHYKGFTVVLVHNDILSDQWLESVKNYTTAKGQVVNKNFTAPDKDTQILICLYTRWSKISSSLRRKIDLLVIDECDEYYNTTGMECIFSFQPLRVIGCTATIKGPKTGLTNMIYNILGKQVVTREFDVRFNVTKIETGIQGLRIPSRYTRGIDYTKLRRSLVENDERNDIILELVDLRISEGRKILILTFLEQHVMALYELLKDKYTCDWMCGKKRNYNNCQVLIAGMKKAGRGFDEEGLCKDWDGTRIDCLILADSVNSETLLTQYIGRVFRTDGSQVDFLVDDDETRRKHWDEGAEPLFILLKAEMSSMEYT